jgi:hypothetical protein
MDSGLALPRAPERRTVRAVPTTVAMTAMLKTSIQVLNLKCITSPSATT